MKKFITILAVLLISFVSIGQTQFRRTYDTAISSTTGETKSNNVFLFNYGGTTDLKVYLSSDETVMYEQLSDFEDGETESGYKYIIAEYANKETGYKMHIQVFSDRADSVRLLLNNGESIECTNKN